MENVLPFCSLAATALSSGEVFKITIPKLQVCVRHADRFDEFFKFSNVFEFI